MKALEKNSHWDQEADFSFSVENLHVWNGREEIITTSQKVEYSNLSLFS